MSWRDSQRFMRVASVVRAIGWTLSALTLVVGAISVFQNDGDDALLIVNAVAAALAVLIGGTHVGAWFIEKHAERVVVR